MMDAQCFTHFQPYIKGREELVLTIYSNGADPQEKPRIWQMLTKGYGLVQHRGIV